MVSISELNIDEVKKFVDTEFDNNVKPALKGNYWKSLV